MRCKVKVTKDVIGIFPEYKPVVGKVYEAEYIPRSRKKYKDKYHGHGEFCVIDMLDKKIILRVDEFEIAEA